MTIFWKLSYPSILFPSISHKSSSVCMFFNILICLNNNLGYCSSVGFKLFGTGYVFSSLFNKGFKLYILIEVYMNCSSRFLLMYLSKFPPTVTNKGLSKKY